MCAPLFNCCIVVNQGSSGRNPLAAALAAVAEVIGGLPRVSVCACVSECVCVSVFIDLLRCKSVYQSIIYDLHTIAMICLPSDRMHLRIQSKQHFISLLSFLCPALYSTAL